MKSSKLPETGACVLVKFHTHDGLIWNEAQVLDRTQTELQVEYPDKRRESLPHDQDRYRIK